LTENIRPVGNEFFSKSFRRRGRYFPLVSTPLVIRVRFFGKRDFRIIARRLI